MQADVAVQKILNNEHFKKQIVKLSGDTLTIMGRNREIARHYAQEGIKLVEPENLNDEYIEKVADSLQKLAHKTLEKRASKK